MADGKKNEQADYVIVGGGSAGCVLANRLSEDPNSTVILLEAGGDSESWLSRMPAGLAKIMVRPEYDWSYMTEPDPSLGGRRVMWNAGKLLGGGSGINGMIYNRGSRADYDAMAAAGCIGWGWDDVLPYFRKNQDYQGEPSQTHGQEGQLAVSEPREYHTLTDSWLDACEQIGISRADDHCGGNLDGAFRCLTTMRRGQRWSSARAHIEPIRKRPNLRVVTHAMADRVLFTGGHATGVAYVRHGMRQEVDAMREVIVSAGAVQSPALLLRSGIGPGGELRKMGIDLIADAPLVGKNLQEHASVPISRFANIDTYNSMTSPVQMAQHALNYFLFGKGVFTTAAIQGMAFARSQPELEHPDIKLQFTPLLIDPHTRTPHKLAGVTMMVNVTPPRSRGEIRLRSIEPTDRPVIDHRLMGDPDDMKAMIRGLKMVEQLYESPALSKFISGRCTPAEKPNTDAEWEDYVRRGASIGFHLVGTCQMGKGDTAVVDPQLRVRGVQGLRVIDCSIFPILPSANTNGPAMMVGEKGAELVKEAARAA